LIERKRERKLAEDKYQLEKDKVEEKSRIYSMVALVDGIRLAYASTVSKEGHKAFVAWRRLTLKNADPELYEKAMKQRAAEFWESKNRKKKGKKP
jgi:hypothetical protein